MNGPERIIKSASDIRASNVELDRLLWDQIDRIQPSDLRVAEADGDWTLAELLGHIGEFPHFFADQIRGFMQDPEVIIGRTHEHGERLKAVSSAIGRSLEPLRTSCQAALDDLTDALVGIKDEHLGWITRNVKYGEEPFTAYVDRYILGHKSGHVEQLARTIAVARGQS